MKEYLWLMLVESILYFFVIMALIYGWGLWPKSWFWVIFFYCIIGNIWPFVLWVRTRFINKLEGDKK